MPPRKKQKTDDDTGTGTDAPANGEGSSSEPNKSGDVIKRDVTKIPPHEYVCIPRPLFDFKAEARYSHVDHKSEDEDENEDEEDEDEEWEARQKYRKNAKEEEVSGKLFQPASENKDWKWIMMWESWEKFQEYATRTVFCDPDRFGMYIFNDWKGYGVQECLDNLLADFNNHHAKGNVDEAWAALSALAHWLNEGDADEFMLHDDGERCQASIALIGCALLTALATIEAKGELKPDSKYLDLPLVITSFLEWMQGAHEQDFRDWAIDWQTHALDYFTRGKLGEESGISGTKVLLAKVKEKTFKARREPPSDTDPWHWNAMFKDYTSEHGAPKLGNSRKYDIRMMSRKDRAKHAFDKKDPFKGIPPGEVKELRVQFTP